MMEGLYNIVLWI